MRKVFAQRVMQAREVHVRVNAKPSGSNLLAVCFEPGAQLGRARVGGAQRSRGNRQRLGLSDEREEALFETRQVRRAHDNSSVWMQRARSASRSTTAKAGTASSHSISVETRPKCSTAKRYKCQTSA